MYLRMLIIGLIGLLAAVSSTDAATIYKWVDTNGLTHYSETPPVDVKEATQFDFSDQGKSVVAETEDYYSIQNQLQRVQQQRRDYLERKLLQKQLVQATREVDLEPVTPIIIEKPVVVSGYRPFYGLSWHQPKRTCAAGACGHYHKQHRVKGLEHQSAPKRKAFRYLSNH